MLLVNQMVRIITIILSTIGLIYFSLIIPVDSEENRTIWVGILFMIAVHILVARSFFYLGLVNSSIKEDEL